MLTAFAASAAVLSPREGENSVAPADRIGPDDLFRLRKLGDYKLSPNGSTIAYVRRDPNITSDSYINSLRLIEVATGRELTVSNGASDPIWSPDGKSLAYVKAYADGHSQLYIAKADGTDMHSLGTPRDNLETLVWSPKGDTIAFTSFVPSPRPLYVAPVVRPAVAHWAAEPTIFSSIRIESDGEREFVPGRAQLFTMALVDGAIRQLTDADADVAGPPVWSPDGKSLVFSSERGDELLRSYQTAKLYRVSVGGGDATPISPEGVGAREATISPDGSLIAFIAAGNTGRDYEPSGLYLMRADGSGVRRLDGGLDREVSDARFAADGKSIYFTFGDQSVTRLARVGLDAKREIIVDHIDDGYDFSTGGAVLYAIPSPGAPANLAVRSRDGKDHILTHLNEDLLRDRVLATIRAVAVKSSLDGASVGTWLVLPPGYRADRRYPLILSIHGGPYGADSPSWDPQDQLLAAAGYAVLHANYRGSISYGSAFAERIAKDYPGPAYADLMSAVDTMIAHGIADPKRLYVTGGSAGGYLTAWIVGRTNRFRAAVAMKPIINTTSEALTTDQVTGSPSVYGGFPWEIPAAYSSSSPLMLVGKVSTPTMLIVGDVDKRTPSTEAQQFYMALKLRKIPSIFAIIPDAGHNSLEATPSRLIATTTMMLDWFGRYGGETVKKVIQDVPVQVTSTTLAGWVRRTR